MNHFRLIHNSSLLFLFAFLSTLNGYGLQVTIIESQSYLATDIMDLRWQTVVNGMGHTSSILPQSTLDNTSFFAATDVLIISSGSINLPPNRVNIITQFLQTGKPVYLQGEYNCSNSSNIAFASLVNTLGGTFTWGGITNGILQMNILGSFATTQTPILNPILPNYNYGCHGTGCGIQYFLERNGLFYGYFFCPPNPSNGRLIQITDQDWIINSVNDTLMKNMFTHLIDPALCSATNFTPTNLGSDTTLCFGNTMILNATNSAATYLWQDGSTNPTYTVTLPGTYWVQVSNNCGVFSDTIHINYSAAPIVNLGPDTNICAGQSYILNATQPGATYTWQDGSHNPTFNVIASGIYSVSISIGGCTVSDNVIVNIIPSPVVNFGNDTSICQGKSILLNATIPGASYLWQDGAVTPTYLVTQTGNYSVQVNTSCGIVSDLIHIDVLPSPIVQLGNDTSICQGEVITFNASQPNATYLWSNGTMLSSLQVGTPGIFWVDVTSQNCTTRDSVVVSVTPQPEINLGPDIKLCRDKTLLLDATTLNATYNWQDNSTSSTYLVKEKGLYWVLVNVNSCIGSDSIFVDYYPESCNCDMVVPNAFSPNNDGKNDEFKYIVSESNIELKDFIIFNRWGDIAFKAQNSFDSWNGKTRGVEADMGTYFYQIRYKCLFTKQEYVIKGDVLLIR